MSPYYDIIVNILNYYFFGLTWKIKQILVSIKVFFSHMVQKLFYVSTLNFYGQ